MIEKSSQEELSNESNESTEWKKKKNKMKSEWNSKTKELGFIDQEDENKHKYYWSDCKYSFKSDY